MAQEKGLVTSITEDGWAQVETDRNDACSHCGSCRVSFGSNSEMIIKAINRAGAGVGDLVSIHLSSGTIVKSAAILYLIPVAGLISGASMGEGLSTRLAISPTSAIALSSLAGFILGFIITALISRWMSARRTLSPIITRIIRRGIMAPVSSPTPSMKLPAAHAARAAGYSGEGE
ncbi:MAG: SoxR reducing system RseC family protein [Deltaproteobacteria bacterium]|nr:SoxR reducing system RseC family protein [Deltaproteobacteria bacterium]